MSVPEIVIYFEHDRLKRASSVGYYLNSKYRLKTYGFLSRPGLFIDFFSMAVHDEPPNKLYVAIVDRNTLIALKRESSMPDDYLLPLEGANSNLLLLFADQFDIPKALRDFRSQTVFELGDEEIARTIEKYADQFFFDGRRAETTRLYFDTRGHPSSFRATRRLQRLWEIDRWAVVSSATGIVGSALGLTWSVLKLSIIQIKFSALEIATAANASESSQNATFVLNKDFVIAAIFCIIFLCFVWAIWVLSFSKSREAIDVARDAVKTLLGFFVGAVTGFLGG